MHKTLYILIGLFFGLGVTVYGVTLLTVPQGGTGAGTLTGCLTGNGTGAITGTGVACGAGGSTYTFGYPFTLGVGFVSTSTVIGFNGLFSTASSTFSGPLHLPLITSSLISTDSLGNVYGSATTTVTCTGSASCTTFTTTGSSPITINVAGASSGFGFPFDINTGYNSTTTALALHGGFTSNASSTISSALRLASLSQGFSYIGTNGLVGSISSSTIKTSWLTNDSGFITGVTADSPLSGSGTSASHLVISTAGTWSGNAGTATALAGNGANCAAGYFPLGVDASGVSESCTYAVPFNFQVNTGYNSTSTTLAFGGGFSSTASSTIASTLYLANLSQGFSTIGSSGNVSSISSSTIKTSWLTNDSNFITLASLSGTYPILYNSSSGAFTFGYSYPFTATSYGMSTTSAIGFLTGGLFSTASSTFSSDLYLTSLAQGLAYVGSSGKVNTIASSSLNVGTATALAANGTNCNAGYFPLGVDASGVSESCTYAVPFNFTVNTGYNSTSTVIGFNGLFSTGSTTISNTFHLPLITSSFLGTDSLGNVYGLASSSIKLSTLNNDSGFVTSSGVTSVTGTWPIISSGGNTPAISWGGLSTTTALTTGQLAGISGVNTLYSVATSAPTCSGGLTCSGVVTLGSSPTLSVFNYPFPAAATSTTVSFGNGFNSTASSTIAATLYLANLSQGFAGIGSGGNIYSISSSTPKLSWFTNDLANLTAGDSSLTLSGNYNGSTARTAVLNVGNTNTWTVLQNFNFSSTTGQATFQHASTTLLTFGGVTGNKWTDFCTTITGGAGLCDGTDATGSGFSGSPNSIVTSDASGNLIATGTQLTVGNILATTTAVNSFAGVLVAPDGTLSNPAFSFADDQNNGIYSPSNDVFAILTNGVERLRISDSSGYSSFGTTTQGIGILTLGTSTAPQLTLSSNTGNVAQWTERNAGGDLFFSTTTVAGTATTSTAALTLKGNGKPGLGISTSTMTATLTVETRAGDYNNAFFIGSTSELFRVNNSGNIFAPNTGSSGSAQTGYWCYDANGQFIRDTVVCLAISAARFKQNIEPLTAGLDTLLKLKPVSYKLKPDYNTLFKDNPNYNGTQYGLIADDVQKVDPHLVTVETVTTTFEGKTYPPGTVHGLADTNNWVGFLVKSIQDLNQKIVKVQRSAEENWQDILIGLLILYVVYNEYQKRK